MRSTVGTDKRRTTKTPTTARPDTGVQKEYTMSKKVFSVIEKVTPEMAVMFLANNPSNRPINSRSVQFLCRQMMEGRWNPHVSPIMFNSKGHLIDGQTRLSALVRYGKPVIMELRHNVPDSIRPHIDTGRKRTEANWLGMIGHKNGPTLASAAKIVRAYENGSVEGYWKHGDFSPLEAEKFVEAHSGLCEFVNHVCANRNMILQQSPHAAMAYLFSRVNEKLAWVFCREFKEGFEPFHNPAFHSLREVLIKARLKEGFELTRPTILAYCILAWNAERKNRSWRRFNWVQGKDEFPTIL